MKHKQAYRQWLRHRRHVTVDEPFTESVMEAIGREPKPSRVSTARRWAAAALWIVAVVGFVHRLMAVFSFLMLFDSRAH